MRQTSAVDGGASHVALPCATTSTTRGIHPQTCYLLALSCAKADLIPKCVTYAHASPQRRRVRSPCWREGFQCRAAAGWLCARRELVYIHFLCAARRGALPVSDAAAVARHLDGRHLWYSSPCCPPARTLNVCPAPVGGRNHDWGEIMIGEISAMFTTPLKHKDLFHLISV